MRWVLVSLVLVCSSQASQASVSVSCKDENNNDVDWYILYKEPKIGSLTGLRYIYIDSSTKRVVSQPINNPNGALANTLGPMLTNNLPSSFGFLSYSDQPPKPSAPPTFGHSKGVVLGDSGTHTALWLTHSTPKFPSSRNKNEFWPDSGTRYGQTFMCVALPFSELSAVGKHLQYIQAFPFDKLLPSGFPKELIDAGNKVPAPAPGSFQSLMTRGHRQLKMMAKRKGSDASTGDLYVALAAGFGSDMNSQTWGCQRVMDQSFCEPNKHKVMNVEEIHTELGNWTTRNDHSKWAVTTVENMAWTCVSDVNRAPTQYERSGGALCMDDKSVHSYFKGFVKSTLQCRKRPESCVSERAFDSGLTVHSISSRATAVLFCALTILLFWG